MKILFLCVGNSIRSQMAEGLAKKIWGKKVIAESAGSHPSFVHPSAIEVMKEIGIDISTQKSQSINDFNLDDFNYIITLCAEEYCPDVSSAVKKLHWPFADPYNLPVDKKDPLQTFRVVRDQIEKKLKKWNLSENH